MKNKFLFLLLILNTICFAQTNKDSLAIKNQKIITDLRNRISKIENPNAFNDSFLKEIEQLKMKVEIQHDSIIALNDSIDKLNKRQFNTLELNNESKKNSIALNELGECNCVRLYYNPYKTEIDYKSFKELDSIATICLNNPQNKLKLIGHADKSGVEGENITLSKKRVASLKNYLVTFKKIPAKSIILEWHGSSVSFKDTQDVEKQFLNRRAEVFLLP